MREFTIVLLCSMLAGCGMSKAQIDAYRVACSTAVKDWGSCVCERVDECTIKYNDAGMCVDLAYARCNNKYMVLPDTCEVAYGSRYAVLKGVIALEANSKADMLPIAKKLIADRQRREDAEWNNQPVPLTIK